MTPFSWKKNGLKALKTALVAGGTYFLLQPGLGGEILKVIPAQFQAIAVILIPAAITAARNWLKNHSNV